MFIDYKQQFSGAPGGGATAAAKAAAKQAGGAASGPFVVVGGGGKKKGSSKGRSRGGGAAAGGGGGSSGGAGVGHWTMEGNTRVRAGGGIRWQDVLGRSFESGRCRPCLSWLHMDARSCGTGARC